MKVQVVLIAALVATLVAAPGVTQNAGPDPEMDAELQAARERLDEAARELAELHREVGLSTGFDVQRVPLPMRLGMFLGRPLADGIQIMGVTPEGPAASAGLESGDLLTSINGHPLAGAGMEARRGLRDATSELGPGDYVLIEYRRGDEILNAEIVVGDPQHPMAAFGSASTGSISMATSVSDYTAGPALRPMGVVLHDLNPGLGRYFSVDAGILVLNGGDDPDALMPGDVITELNGEAVTRQHELFAGLRAGEASLTVIRNGGALNLPLERDALMGGMGVMQALPVGGMRMIELQQYDAGGDGGHDVEVLINSDASLGGDGL